VIVAVALLGGLAIMLLGLGGCTPRVRVDPIEVKPIHIVHDINIRVDRHLDDFFAFQDQPAATQPDAAATQATTQTAVTAGGVR
jgi:hypothetical protein